MRTSFYSVFVFVLAFNSIYAQAPPVAGDNEAADQIRAVRAIAQLMRADHNRNELGFNLSDLTLVKLVDEATEPFVFFSEYNKMRFRPTTAQNTVSYRTEKRTRKVIVDGEEIDQVYNVAIPITTTRRMPGNAEAIKKFAEKPGFPLKSIDFYDINLARIDDAEVIMLLQARPRTVVFFQQRLKDGIQLSPLVQSALDSELLFAKVRTELIGTE